MRLAALTALSALALAAPAGAATLELSYLGSAGITFTAEPGEVNDLTVFHSPRDGGLRVHDEGAPIRVVGEAGNCFATEERTVECFSTPPEVVIRTLDGDDRLEVSGAPIPRHTSQLGDGDDVATAAFGGLEGGAGDDTLSAEAVDGGEGNDRLTVVPGGALPAYSFGRPGALGGPGADVITGSEAADYLSPGPGPDEVRAGRGDDTIADSDGASGAPDVYDGEAGVDEVSYWGRPARLEVDLAAGTASEDRLAGIESAAGGHGDDVLLGSDDANRLDGSQGDDTLVGRGGDDTLVDWVGGDDQLAGGAGRDALRAGAGSDVVDGGEGDDPELDGGAAADFVFGGAGNDGVAGGPGPDRLDGGEGNDALFAGGDWFRDSVACGPGRDGANVDRGDVADETCEEVARQALGPLLTGHPLRAGRRLVSVTGGRALVFPPCLSVACHGTITLRVGRRLAGRGRWDCGIEHEDYCLRPFELAAAVPVRAWVRRLLRRRSVRATALLVQDPGIDAGALAAPERVLLVRRD